jgi:hypothetical protein
MKRKVLTFPWIYRHISLPFFNLTEKSLNLSYNVDLWFPEAIMYLENLCWKLNWIFENHSFFNKMLKPKPMIHPIIYYSGNYSGLILHRFLIWMWMKVELNYSDYRPQLYSSNRKSLDLMVISPVHL